MHSHGPDCLEGPLSRGAPWWFAAASLPPSPSAALPQKDDPRSVSNGRIRESQPFRADLVERVRREIAEGRYDTPEKWLAALARLLDQLSRP
jgi:hypothetical protein